MHKSPQNLIFDLLQSDPQSPKRSLSAVDENAEANLLGNLKYVIEREKELHIPIEDPIAQERIQKLLGMENLADITLPGFVIKFLRLNGPIAYKSLSEEVAKCFEALRRSDGSRYNGDHLKALKGCLSSSDIFTEHDNGVWTMDDNHAKNYEQRTTKKIKSMLINQVKKSAKKGKKEEDGEEHHENGVGEEKTGNQNGNSGKNTRSKNVKESPSLKRPFDSLENTFEVLNMTCKAYKTEKKAEFFLHNPLQDVKKGETLQQLTQKFGKEKLAGIIQCYDYFAPVLEDYMKLKSMNRDRDELWRKIEGENNEKNGKEK